MTTPFWYPPGRPIPFKIKDDNSTRQSISTVYGALYFPVVPCFVAFVCGGGGGAYKRYSKLNFCIFFMFLMWCVVCGGGADKRSSRNYRPSNSRESSI